MIQQQKHYPIQRQFSSESVVGDVAKVDGTENSSVATTITTSSSSPGGLRSSSSSTGSEIPPLVWNTHRLSKEQIEKVDGIFHKLLWLDVFETQQLMMLIQEKLGRFKFTPAKHKLIQREMDARVHARNKAKKSGSGVQDTAGTDEAAVEELKPKFVDLKLVGYDEKSKIKVIKEVRALIEGLGLKEAKEMVEGIPRVLHKSIKPELAEEYKAKLEAVGAKLEIIVL